MRFCESLLLANNAMLESLLVDVIWIRGTDILGGSGEVFS